MKGYTLLELLVVIILIGLILSAGYMGLRMLVERTVEERERADLTTTRLHFISRMKRDIFRADRAYASPSSGEVRLVSEGRTVRYELEEERITRRVDDKKKVVMEVGLTIVDVLFQGRPQGGTGRPFDRLKVAFEGGEGGELSFTFRKSYGARSLMELKAE